MLSLVVALDVPPHSYELDWWFNWYVEQLYYSAYIHIGDGPQTDVFTDNCHCHPHTLSSCIIEIVFKVGCQLAVAMSGCIYFFQSSTSDQFTQSFFESYLEIFIYFYLIE